MNTKPTILESIKDRIGQEVKAGDIVLYPKMNGQSPMMTLAMVLNIKKKTDWRGDDKIIIRIKVIDETHWGLRDKYPAARVVIGTYETSLTRHSDNLVKISKTYLTKLEYDVLVDDKIIPVYNDLRTDDSYDKSDIIKITGTWMWGK
jgi:hypothetical protein